MAERIQKLMAAVGVASRRQVETMISEGRISVNGEIAKLGDRAEYSDTIRLDGRVVKIQHRPDAKHRVLIYHKPEGEICSRSDPEGRTTIFEALPNLRSGRWIAVGRLDINTSGLVLLTTDGELANRLMHPSSEIEREYAVRVAGEVDKDIVARLKKGVELEDGLAKFDDVRDAGGQGYNHWYHVILAEGRKREVRRLWESQGLVVSRLMRVRYGEINLRRGSKPGEWDELETGDIQKLRKSVGMEVIEEKVLSRKKYFQRKESGGKRRKVVAKPGPKGKR